MSPPASKADECVVVARTTAVFAGIFTLGAAAMIVLAWAGDDVGEMERLAFALLAGSAAVALWGVYGMVRRILKDLEPTTRR